MNCRTPKRGAPSSTYRSRPHEVAEAGGSHSRLRCPTGCAGRLQRPFARRAEPVRCPNCRAWLAAPASAEDGTLVEALLLAAPGAPLATAGSKRRRLGWVLLAAVVLALLGFAGVKILW